MVQGLVIFKYITIFSSITSMMVIYSFPLSVTTELTEVYQFGMVILLFLLKRYIAIKFFPK